MDPSTLAPGMISTVDQGPGAYRPGMTYRSAATFSNSTPPPGRADTAAMA
jgi:hypothetical protein